MDDVSVMKETYQMHPIGYVHRSKEGVFLELFEPSRSALHKLNHFSHVMVFWWADKHDNEKSRSITQTTLPYAKGVTAGVFACRAEYRPNPIAITICKILKIDEANGLVKVANIDAFDGTPIVDLKAYFPVCDRVKDFKVPVWVSDWPKWLPEEGIGLENE